MPDYQSYSTPNYPNGNPYLNLSSAEGWITNNSDTAGTRIGYNLLPGWNMVSVPGELPTGSKTINGLNVAPNTLQFLFNPNWYPTLTKAIAATTASQVIDFSGSKQWTGSITSITPQMGFWIWNESEFVVPWTFQIKCLYGDNMKIQWGNNNNFVSYPLVRQYPEIENSVLENGAGSANLLNNDKVVQVIGAGDAAAWNTSLNRFEGSLKTLDIGGGYWVKLNNSPPDNTYGWGSDDSTPGTAQQFWKDQFPPPLGTDHPIEDNFNFHFQLALHQCFYNINLGAYTMDNQECVVGEDWIASYRGTVCTGSTPYPGRAAITYDYATPTYTGTGLMIPCMTDTGHSYSVNSFTYNHSPDYNFNSFGAYKTDEIPTFLIYDYSNAEYQLARIEDSTSGIVNMSSHKIASETIYGDLSGWRLKGYAKLQDGV